MKKFKLILFTIICFNAFCQDQGNYQLIINGKTETIDVDQKIIYKTPNGENIEIELKQKPILSYSDNFVSFEYPKEYKPTKTDLGSGIEQIAIFSSLGTGVMIQEYSTMNPETMNELMLTEITKERIEYGYKMKRKDFTHKTKSGQEITGIKATLKYQDDIQEYIIASFGQKDKGVLVMTMINDEFRKQEKIILETFYDSLFLNF